MPKIPKIVPTTEDRIAEAQRMLTQRAEEQREKNAKNKAFWDEYNKQLARSTPHQGGAKKYNRHRITRVFPFYRLGE